jgi:hypothetical protein
MGRAVSTFFAEYSLVSYVLATAIVISCLVLTARRISFCGRAVTNLWAFVLANLVFLVIHVLLLLMVRPVGDFAGTVFSFLGTNYGGLSYGRILTGFIAEVVGIVALVGMYGSLSFSVLESRILKMFPQSHKLARRLGDPTSKDSVGDWPLALGLSLECFLLKHTKAQRTPLCS